MTFDLLLGSSSLALLFLHLCLFLQCRPRRNHSLTRRRKCCMFGSTSSPGLKFLALYFKPHNTTWHISIQEGRLRPRYLSCAYRKQIEFLSSCHFNSCQEMNIKDLHKLRLPTAMWFSHLLGPVTHCQGKPSISEHVVEKFPKDKHGSPLDGTVS